MTLDALIARESRYFAPHLRSQVLTPAPVARWLARQALGRVPAPATVLDPAAGTGRLLAAVEEICVGQHRLLAVESDPEAAHAMTALCPSVRVQVGDGLQVTFGGVDAIVMNPPYGNADKLDGAFHERAASRWPFHRRQLDLSAFFLAAALECLRPGGRMACIVPRYWLEATRAAPFRAWFATNAQVERIVDLGNFQVFEGAEVLTALVVAKRPGEDRRNPALFCRIKDRAALEQLWDDEAPDPPSYPVATLGAAPWSARAPQEEARLELLESGSGRLGDWFEIGQGVKTGRNSVFVRSGEEVEALGLGGPWLRRMASPRDIVGEEGIRNSDRWLLRVLPGDGAPGGSLGDWLSSHREALEARYQVRDGSVPWYALSIAQNLHLMEATPKIVHPLYARRCRFGLDTVGYYIGTGAYALAPRRPLPVPLSEMVAWLNGEEAQSWVMARTKLKRAGYREFGRRALQSIPVPWKI